jgi:hypothetical protein
MSDRARRQLRAASDPFLPGLPDGGSRSRTARKARVVRRRSRPRRLLPSRPRLRTAQLCSELLKPLNAHERRAPWALPRHARPRSLGFSCCTPSAFPPIASTAHPTRWKVGIVLGLVAVGVGSAALAARAFPVALDGNNYALMPAGGIAAAALWAASGLRGALRNQVATPVAIVLWLFFVENLLLDFVPGAGGSRLAQRQPAISGLDPDRLLAAGPRWVSARPLRRGSCRRRRDRHAPPRCSLDRPAVVVLSVN